MESATVTTETMIEFPAYVQNMPLSTARVKLSRVTGQGRNCGTRVWMFPGSLNAVENIQYTGKIITRQKMPAMSSSQIAR